MCQCYNTFFFVTDADVKTRMYVLLYRFSCLTLVNLRLSWKNRPSTITLAYLWQWRRLKSHNPRTMLQTIYFHNVRLLHYKLPYVDAPIDCFQNSLDCCPIAITKALNLTIFLTLWGYEKNISFWTEHIYKHFMSVC